MYVNTTLEYLRECKKKCRFFVEHKLDTEKSYMSATHVSFVKSIRFVNSWFDFMIYLIVVQLLDLKRNRFL